MTSKAAAKLPETPRSRSLRRLFRQAAFLLLALAIIAMIALLAASAYLHEVANDLSRTVDSLQVAEEIQTQLLLHQHAMTLAVLESGEAQAREAGAAAQELMRLISSAHERATRTEEHKLLDDLQTALQVYLADASSLISTRPGDERRRTELLAAAFDKAFAETHTVVLFDMEQARVARRHSQINRAAGVTAIALSIGLLVALALLGRSLRGALFLPLEQVSASIRAYAHDRARRAPELGSTELRGIAQAFNSLASELQTQRENQMRFLGGVAHDLRTPLTALKSACMAVRPDRQLPSEPNLRRLLLVAARSVDRLNSMVEDLLDISRVELGRLPIAPEHCDLREIARNTAALFESPGQKVVLVLPDTPVMAWCDASRIAQVLNNLVSNAIKYSPEGSTVRVSAHTAADATGILEVTDAGIGIAPEELASIFQPFRRSSFTKDAIPGVGLGLFISKQLVEAHGGTLTVESSPGQGSTFRIVLPGSP